MPGKTTPALGNEQLDTVVYLAAVTYPTIAANSIASNTATIPGVLPLDILSWSMQNPPAHLALENIWVSSANTITITWSSDTTGISTGTVPILFEIVRVDGANLGVAAFPTALT